MQRVVARWWLIGSLLVLGVLGASWLVYREESAHQLAARRARGLQAQLVLRQAVADALDRERALAHVIGVLRSPIGDRWATLAAVVTGSPAATGASFIVPVPERDRAAFERQTGLKLTESPAPGVIRPAGDRPLHLVVLDSLQEAHGTRLLGLDLAANPLRERLLLEAARTGQPTASPPTEFLGRPLHRYGVIVYDAVRDSHQRLEGWVVSSYRAMPLAQLVTADLPGLRLTIRDGNLPLVDEIAHTQGAPMTLSVGGRRWEVWASAGGAGDLTNVWLVLGLGLGLAGAVSLVLRQTVTRERYALAMLDQRDLEEAALGRIATAVAEQAAPAEVFSLVAEEVGRLLNSRTAAVSRFDQQRSRGTIVGSWTPDGADISNSTYALDGDSASAEVYRTGNPARTSSYRAGGDPVARLMREIGGLAGIAAPVVVAGAPWGALGAAYGVDEIPHDAEERLVRFARLVGLAIANAAAWDALSRQASTDALTGMPNRRVFDDRLVAELARARRYDRRLSLAILDIDRFKGINDRFGHQVGDRVLVRVAQLLTETAREGELIARIGGEEFAWLMPETDQSGALRAAERARQAIAGDAFDEVGRVTISIGVRAALDADLPETLVRDADQALYWAKTSGRNQTFVYSEEALDALAHPASAPEHSAT